MIMQFGYENQVDRKLADLNWTEAQYDFFLNYLHCDIDRHELVQLLLELADNTWLESLADGIGTFDLGGEFSPGNKNDWEPRLCGQVTTHGPISGERTVQQWAIFNVKTGEWRDPKGDCLCFESRAEAQAYLNGFFDAWKGTEA
jgi:hypothetical protein